MGPAQQMRADARTRDSMYFADSPVNICGEDFICEECWEGMGLVECSEHPWLPESQPLRVKLAEVL
jgi:hypothetical protein